MPPLTQKFLALIFSVQAAVVFSADAEEIILRPDGVNPDAGWALSRVGEEFSGAAINTYAYPDTTVPVRLYLIDTGIANPASFVAANPNLTFEGSIPVGGTASIPRTHGTQMLSLIAGKETGVASGTPIHLLNYDIYTADVASETTTISNLVRAMANAVKHHKDSNTLKMRAVICMATSTQAMTNSYAVEDSINQALAAGIPVVVSAGNLGGNIPVLNYTATTTSTNSSYLPSAYGTKNGVICVGSSDSADLKLSNSNFGAPVDILAPGLNVCTSKSPLVTMTGTSASAALVAGTVLAELSINGSLTPAQVESVLIPASRPALLRTTYASAVTINNPDGPIIRSDSPVALTATASSITAAVRAAQTSPAITPSVDADSDGIPDMIEIFHSGNCDKPPASRTLSRPANQELQFKFPIAFDHFRSSNPFALGNGYTWGILCTWDSNNWEVPVGSLSKTTDSMGQTWLIATFPASQVSCFATIAITAP